MMLESGQWLGRGRVLAEGESRGSPVECHVRVERDAGGATLTGSWQVQDGALVEFQVRLAGNDVGTYILSADLAGDRLHGTAKLDSPPNLGLVWNESGTLSATFALFSVSRGYGFRGFARDASGALAGDGGDAARVYTWEVAFSLRQEVVKGDNIVSLHRRRR